MPSAAMSESVYGASTASPWKALMNELIEVAADVLELGRQPGVAVVVADDEEPAVDERLAELDGPGDQLGAQAHHEQERLVTGVAEGLVADLDPVDGRDGGGHPVILSGP